MVESPQLLTGYLSGRDVNCPSCQYNLRDLQGSRCPECGDLLVLQVGLAEPRQAAGIAGLIGLAAGAGLNGLLLLYLAVRIIFLHDHFYVGMGSFVALNAGGLVAEGAAMFWWLKVWRWTRRQSSTRKTLLVCGCWLLTIVNLLVFAINVK